MPATLREEKRERGFVLVGGLSRTLSQILCLHLVERLGRVESISHVKGCGETGKIESRTATTFRPKKKGPGLPAGA